MGIKEEYAYYINEAHKYINESMKNDSKSVMYRNKAIKSYETLLNEVDITEYLLIDSEPLVPIDVYIESYFNLGTLFKMNAENMIQSKIQSLKNNNNSNIVLEENEMNMFQNSLRCFKTILRVKFEHEMTNKQLISIYTYLCFISQNDLKKALQFLQEGLLFCPTSETLHYNLGFIYQKMNNLEYSLIHYKIAITLARNGLSKKIDDLEKKRCIVNSYNCIGCLYRSIKQWPEALYYLLKADEVIPNDPDVQNQLGTVYTEMRRTDLAKISYELAIKYHKNTFISTDSSNLLSEIYLNYGHMNSYNGDNHLSIENYNKSLQINPRFSLPFQNKLMNLSYLFDELDDKSYILNQHKLVNKLYKKGKGKFKFTKQFYECDKINIGIISGDFIDHPVSFFINTFLSKYDTNKFNMICYSECLIDTSIYNKNIKFKIIKNLSAEKASELIYNDKIHILFDLAGHTALNRLDIFAMKPSPIQITYIGYPYSTGLLEMDYRITDFITDNQEISQKLYTEKLISMNRCFLCYDPNKPSFKLPQLEEQPFDKNKFITIGCFNRLNKMTDRVISIFNTILKRIPTTRFIFKTKALLNKNIKQKFLNKFDKQVRSRISIYDCTISHESHLLTYNDIDVAIDTFPYSGTTTSCEALMMGVPVFTFYDTEYYFHPQNVTVSILKHSHPDLEYYIINNNNIEELIQKINDMSFINLKPKIRKQFLSGNVCDKANYISELTKLLENLYKQKKLLL
jgi:predicted O-linked N-acetylglucosamine transferase (SPINDLY family)